MAAGRMPPFARAMREFVWMRIERGEDREVSFEEAMARSARYDISRRELLRMGGVLGAGLALAACTDNTPAPSIAPAKTSKPTEHGARVVVVGAGLAGVAAAYRLSQVGVNVQLFESRDRVGGRCWTARGFADGQTAEHGGEFIDTRHVHLRGLAQELGLPLDDLWKGYPSHSVWPDWIGGKVWDHQSIHAQMDPISKKVTAAAKQIGALNGKKFTDTPYSYGTATDAAKLIDAMTMSDWLHQNGLNVDPAFAAYLNELMAGWYGLDMPKLSAINWVDYFLNAPPGADERWHVRGGNDQVPNLAAKKLPAGSLHLQTPLTSMASKSDGAYELHFAGMSRPVVADFVILAAPFTTLRHVDLTGSGLSAQKMRAIDQMGMGADVKLLIQYDKRPWKFTVGGTTWSGGMEHTVPNYETWESSTDEPGKSGLITVYAGGATGASWTAPAPHGPGPKPFVSQTVNQIDQVVPGTAAHFNGQAWIDLWTHDPWTQGAYAAFAPGQYTKYWKYNGSPEGNVHFAGEHTSTYSQGYLNGGVESGQRTAIEVMNKLGIPVPKSIGSLPYSKVVPAAPAG